MKKLIYLFFIILLGSSASAGQKERYMIIVHEAPAYSKPDAQEHYKSEAVLKFGTVLFADSVVEKNEGYSFVKATHPLTNKKVYVPLEMTMSSPPLSVKKEGNSITLYGSSELPFYYVPQDLSEIPLRYSLDNKSIYIKQSAAADLERMLRDASQAGHQLYVAQGYKDLSTRIEEYTAALGVNPKQTEVPKPLSSQYGSGRVIDITDSDTGSEYRDYIVNQEAWEWLEKNCEKYGFSRNSSHYALLYTGQKKTVPLITHNAFPEVIDEKINFGSMCSIHVLKRSDYERASYAWVHHNEKSAGETLHYALDTYGGHSVYIINKDRRNLYVRSGGRNYAVDPNRIFTDKGIDLHLKTYYPKLSPSQRRRIARQVKPVRKGLLDNFDWNQNKYLIVLHSSRPDSDFSINEFNKKNMYLTYKNPSQNPKNLYYTTSLDDYYFFKSKKYNVVYQRTAEDDGSLSVYAAQKELPYINIEVEEGKDEDQRKMFDLAIECIRHNYRIKQN